MSGARERHPLELIAARRGTQRTALRVGMAVSLAIHVLLLATLGRMLHLEAYSYSLEVTGPPVPEGLIVLNIDQSESAPEETEELRLEEVVQGAPIDIVRGELTPVPSVVARVGSLTNAERLRLEEGDPRLWEDFDERPLPEQRLAAAAIGGAALRERLSAILDSLALSDEQRTGATEWLFGEGDQTWGITPDGIRLGGITIPISLGQLFQEEGARGRESRQRERDRLDIQHQDMLQDADRVLKERRAAIRERSQEEVLRRQQADSLQAAPPDTSRVREPPTS
ncbi:MAG: hypothetical protein ABFS14_06390 [Gemmatimonadota bacterium]